MNMHGGRGGQGTAAKPEPESGWGFCLCLRDSEKAREGRGPCRVPYLTPFCCVLPPGEPRPSPGQQQVPKGQPSPRGGHQWQGSLHAL